MSTDRELQTVRQGSEEHKSHNPPVRTPTEQQVQQTQQIQQPQQPQQPQPPPPSQPQPQQGKGSQP